MSFKELEWFGLETKMRQELANQLYPILQKSKEDREDLCSTKLNCSKLDSRIHKLESVIFENKNSETFLSQIIKKCSETEGNRKSDNVRFEQELSSISERLKSLSFNVSEIAEKLEILIKQNSFIDSEIEKIKANSEKNKEIILNELNKMVNDFKEANKSYESNSAKIEEKTNTAFAKVRSAAIDIIGLKKELENV